MGRYKILSIDLFIIAIVVAGAVFLQESGNSDIYYIVITVASFLLGIFLAFSISNRQNRFDNIREKLRKDDALLLNIYKLSAAFGRELQTKCQNQIDAFLVMSIDYYLKDYKNAIPEFNKLYDLFVKITPKNAGENDAHSEILASLEASSENKKELTYLLEDWMPFYEWISILILSAVVIGSMFLIINDSTGFTILSILIGSSIVFLVTLLRQLNTLEWKKQSWIWMPLAELFTQLDLQPYMPRKIANDLRIKLRKGITYRLVDYPHPYPDFSDKKVQLVQG